ncbi:hypothetical protein T08_13763 [Trichinella sp. T8]|nr:hypothetical protein T08_13763 [Trichinella sp. T8]
MLLCNDCHLAWFDWSCLVNWSLQLPLGRSIKTPIVHFIMEIKTALSSNRFMLEEKQPNGTFVVGCQAESVGHLFFVAQVENSVAMQRTYHLSLLCIAFDFI